MKPTSAGFDYSPFSIGTPHELDSAWQNLFHQVLARAVKDEQATCAALGLSPWFTDLLLSSGFTHRQDIIVLIWEGVPA